jgi:hypothetical protein
VRSPHTRADEPIPGAGSREPGAGSREPGAGQDRGAWYYRNLAIHIVNYAQGAYEGFDGGADFVLVEARAAGSDEPIRLTYSEMAMWLDCGMAFRLRNLIGFQPRLAPELGYGKAVHHVMRAVAESTRATGRVPGPAEIDAILDVSFFLPTANKPAHRQLKDAARRLVATNPGGRCRAARC